MQRYSSRVSKAPIGKPRGFNLLLLSILITGGLVGGAAMAAGSVIDAENGFLSHGKVVALDGNFSPIANASSTMLRNRHGVTVSVDTTGLEPEAAHTIWFLVFNNPEFCTGSPGLDCDPAAGDVVNPAVQASVLWGGAGRVSDAFGQISLDGTVFEGAPPGLLLFGPGLIDSLKADIHVIVRSHGSAAALEGAGQLAAALTTPGGGCKPNGVNDCADVQAVAHQQ